MLYVKSDETLKILINYVDYELLLSMLKYICLFIINVLLFKSLMHLMRSY